MDKIFRDLVDLPGAPSFEHKVRDYMKSHLEKYSDEIVRDKLGSIFGVINKNSDGPRVMVAGHMDEVGAVVTKINKNGTINMKSLGGVSGSVFSSQHMNIYTDDNDIIPGVTASKPPHLTKGDSQDKSATLQFDELFLDIGANSDEHAKELGVKVGQQIIPHNNYTVTKDGKKFISKAWDDRFGCAMALEIARDINKDELPCKLYTGATVQEEVGLRGAGTSANLIKPDVFIAIDCSPTADTFGGDEIEGKIGEGFLIRFYDPSAIMHRGMKKFFEETAKKHDLKFQYYKSRGGTDAARVQLSNGGVLVATLGMPSRYIHSTTSMIHKDDYESLRKMLHIILKELTWEKVEEIRSNV